MDKDSVLKSILIFILFLLSIIFFGIVLGLILGFLSTKYSPQINQKLLELSPIILGILSVLSILLMFIPLDASFKLTVFYIGSFVLSFTTAFIYKDTFSKWISNKEISTKDFKLIGQDFIKKMQINDNSKALIGYSMKHFKPIYLTRDERVKHTLIAGSTGSGKTTTLKSLFIDAMVNDYPVLIIDPKGNIETINEFKALMKKYSKTEKELEVFSLISPKSSSTYNPLKRGSSVQIKDRLISSLDWSEQYYKNQASAYLTKVIHLFKALDLEVSIRRIHFLLKDRSYADYLENLIKMIKDTSKKEKLHKDLRSLLKTDSQKLDNLISQISDLDNEETGGLLNVMPEVDREIDLLDVIQNRKVVYFQLNTMAYELTAKSIGRLILADLKSLASEIHGGKVKVDSNFFPIFVDEFGSFCSSGFIEMLKMCRDVNFALHLFFQSLADLDVVSKEFKSQVQQNCITKLILRTDDPNEVEFWSSVAGTSETMEASFQYKKFLGLNLRTGLGNSRSSKKMKIEHDVFKQLNVGQSVLIQKSPSKEDLIQLWNPS